MHSLGGVAGRRKTAHGSMQVGENNKKEKGISARRKSHFCVISARRARGGGSEIPAAAL